MSRSGRRRRAAAAAAVVRAMAGAADGPGSTVARITSASPRQHEPWEYDSEDNLKEEDVIDFVRKLYENKAGKLQNLANGQCGLMENSVLDTTGEHCYFDDDDDDIYPYYYADDDDSDEDTEDDYDDYTNDGSIVNLAPGTFCGFKKSFLYPQELSQSKLPSNSMFLDFKMPTRHKITAEEAEKNAKELVAEEERIKNKAEKKRLKKKRQKDRKRQQKLEEELKSNKEIKMGKSSINECNTKEEEMKNEKSVAGSGVTSGKEIEGCKVKNQLKYNSIETTADGGDEEDETEDELDLYSTFVSQVRRKVDMKPKVERKERAAKPEEKEPVKKAVENVPEANPLNHSMTLAGLGNEMAKFQRYREAISFFTKAIILNPREYRLFGNRSYCYERMLQYKEALNDAEVALSLMPHWPKGYFRKGKALMGLKRYTEAKSTFEAVLKANETHVDAALELQKCQMQIILEKRFARENNVLKPQLPDLLLRAPLSQPLQPVAKENKKKAATNAPTFDNCKKCDKNGSATNLSSNDKTQSAIPSEIRGSGREEMGSKLKAQPPMLRFGHVQSIRILYDRTCAFINFCDKEAAEKAFTALQGAEMEGTKFVLQLRNPEHANTNPGNVWTNQAQKPLPKESVKISPNIPGGVRAAAMRVTAASATSLSTGMK
ncbi:tetratricopeptide repeat protein 31 isoform X2 [Rhinatrema bivittatum]|uniref:tetratricopeptide repeat protein 31 isoform X2 n=1 Tax=Rhinatrema bivittatum TaxID=194408 RepID=UPI00112AE51F|nr:tetratricopeptide repeat protein 31 isoform X2 [Rhinatrema bivittatum]